MNAVKSFFKKYHAVPANDRGVQWSAATREALIGHAESLCQAWDSYPDSRSTISADMRAVLAELNKRSELGITSGAEEMVRDGLFSRLSTLTK